jgi:hypothetical protein
MIYRWCIVGEPRCGSHWLHAKLTPTFGMDEIINYGLYTNLNHDFYFDEENNIDIRPTDKPTIPLTEEKFIQKRILQIKKINPLQHSKAILFCGNRTYDYKKIINTLEESNFKFIMLERDLFDRALSVCFISKTNLAHRWNRKKQIFPNPNELEPITISKSDWLETLFSQYQTTEYRKTLFLNRKYITVNYNNLIADCKKNKIPINNDDAIFKTWNVNYEDVAVNIDELKEIYVSFIRNIRPYSKFLVEYSKSNP